MYTVDLNWQDYELEDIDVKVDGKDEKKEKAPPSGIKMQLKSLSYEENQTFMTFSTISGDETSSNFDPAKMPDLLKFIRSILPLHVRNLTGIQMIEDGKAEARLATVDDIVEHGCFLQVAMAIFRKLSSLSSMTKEESSSLKKNLPGSSETT